MLLVFVWVEVAGHVYVLLVMFYPSDTTHYLIQGLKTFRNPGYVPFCNIFERFPLSPGK